jgi:hypothetical protein
VGKIVVIEKKINKIELYTTINSRQLKSGGDKVVVTLLGAYPTEFFEGENGRVNISFYSNLYLP